MEYSDELERKWQVDMLNSTDYSSTLLHGVKNAGQRVGEGVKSYLDSPQQLANTAYTNRNCHRDLFDQDGCAADRKMCRTADG